MLAASRSPIRGDGTAKQFSLRLKTDCENVAEKVRLVEFRYFVPLTSDGSFALVYTPRGESFTLNKNVIKGERLREYWFDPRYGVAYLMFASPLLTGFSAQVDDLFASLP